jgi:hypothetical protein
MISSLTFKREWAVTPNVAETASKIRCLAMPAPRPI